VVLIERPTREATVARLEPESPATSVVELARGTPASEYDLPFVLRRLGLALETARCARLYPGPFQATLDCLTGWLEA
jgi:hypothetical protein